MPQSVHAVELSPYVPASGVHPVETGTHPCLSIRELAPIGAASIEGVRNEAFANLKLWLRSPEKLFIHIWYALVVIQNGDVRVLIYPMGFVK